MLQVVALLASLVSLNAFANDIKIHGAVNSKTLDHVTSVLKNKTLGSTVYVDIDSMGGDTEVATIIISALKSHKTVCYANKAMSAAMYILQACTIRGVSNNSELMIHNSSLLFQERELVDIVDLEAEVRSASKLNALMIGSIAYRMGYTQKALELVISKSSSKEFEISGHEAKSTKTADVVVKDLKEMKKKFK